MGRFLELLHLTPLKAKPAAPTDDPAAARQRYDDDRLALENGDLQKVPAKAPPGMESAHAAIAAARKALPAAPGTLAECTAANKALATLAKKVADYLVAEAAALARVKKKFDDGKAALDADLGQVPDAAPAGLEAPHAIVAKARAALPADPKTIGDYVAGLHALPALKAGAAAYLKAAATKKRVDDGLAKFGSAGSGTSGLKDFDTLNAEQKKILDDKLRERIAKSGKEIPEKDLQKFAQTVVEKTNKLAETPLEKKIPGINAKLAKSETLKTNIVKLQQAKWKIKVNKAGGGSYCDKVNKTIAIDPSDPLEESLGGLAHETGHALYKPPPKPTVKASASGVDYVRQSTEVDFLDEGEAQFVACKAKKDLDAEGVSANVPADSAGKFMAIYTRFKDGSLTEDAARKEMAKEFGNLITSTTKEPYLKYYGKAHIANWNAAHKKDPAQQLADSILDTMTLFP